MKNRLFIASLLTAALVFPAFAQQSTSSSNAQPAASDQVTTAHETATGKQPLQAGSHDFWDGDQPGVAWLILHPFASKQYVHRNLQAVQDRVTELDELTSSNSKMIRDVDTRAQQGIQQASAKADMADQHARDAATKADTANQTATALNTRIAAAESNVGSVDQYKSTTQAEIRFRPGQTALSKTAKDALDELAAQLKDQHGYIVEVQGFASGQGQVAIANSRRIADSVVRYLVLNHEIPAYRIYTLAMGNAPTEKHGGATRVEVSLLKNGLEQTAQQ
jgi:outer membrane protein OmpA-like peptidoglycan-associated protein